MPNVGDAYAIASAIYASPSSIEDRSGRLYATLASHTTFGSDEAKADLYAQLEEKLTPSHTFEQAVEVIAAAINETKRALMQ